jgi:hypothetical protein
MGPFNVAAIFATVLMARYFRRTESLVQLPNGGTLVKVVHTLRSRAEFEALQQQQAPAGKKYFQHQKWGFLLLPGLQSAFWAFWAHARQLSFGMPGGAGWATSSVPIPCAAVFGTTS